jgi:long-chain acyl-CoA synthetase
MNVSGLVRAAAQQGPGESALVDFPEKGTITYGDLDARVQGVANALRGYGLTAGDRVAVALGNRPEAVAAYFGILRAGGVAVPVNPQLTAREVAQILADSEPRWVLARGPGEGIVADAASRQTSVQRVVTSDGWPEPSYSEADEAGVDEGDLAVIAYTSGTTGIPRGAMLTHGNLLANLRQQMAVPGAEVQGDDVVLLALPVSHIFGLNVTLGLTVANAATAVLVDRFDPADTLRMIEEQGVTLIFGAPPMYAAWLESSGNPDLSRVRFAVSGAAPLHPGLLLAFQDRFGVPIFEGYGLTETAPTLTSCLVGGEVRPGSIGRPLPDVELRLADDGGADVELGDPGEIVVRGPNVFRGYWRKEDETRAAFRDGWFHTGDVAVQDEDGYLYLVDRKRDLIIVSGFNVYPAEVEAALAENPAVKEAAVVGVPDTRKGESIRAYVVLENGAEAGETELLDDVKRRIARFKWPESIEVVSDLPHMLTGKVARYALRV